MKDEDSLQRFLFESIDVRGEWVRLTQSWQAAKINHTYGLAAQQQLGNALAAVTLLSATIKFKGSLILQAQGDGQLSTLVAQATQDQQIRGWAKGNLANLKAGTLAEMYGDGRLVLTIKSDAVESYQGIVPLVGDHLSAAIENYFSQSEQLQTRFWLFSNVDQAVGLMLQEIPGQQEACTDWQRIEMLAETVTQEELLTLSCEEMLFRLFSEEKVRLFAPQSVTFSCSCSSEKIISTLLAVGRKTIEEVLQQQGSVTVDCEFCSQTYRFDQLDINRIFSDKASLISAKTTH